MQGFRARVGSATFVIVLAIAGGAPLGCGRKAPPPPQAVNRVKPSPVTKIAPATPIQVKRVELGGPTWNPAWDRVIELSLPRAMLSTRVPRDVQRFCPRFYRMSGTNKREFWAYFFQALAAAEAGLNPRANVRHTEPQVAVRDPVTGEMVHSEGLLQLAYEDARRYGCNFNWRRDRELGAHDPARTILNPINNLKCGIKILSHQIIWQHKPLFSPTGYWSTLHPGTLDYRVFAKQMANTPQVCRVPSHELAGQQNIAPASNQPGSASPAEEEEAEASAH